MKKHAKEAAKALSDLNMFYAIIALCDGSLISSEYQPALTKIIEICRNQAGLCLVVYDRNLSAIATDEGQEKE